MKPFIVYSDQPVNPQKRYTGTATPFTPQQVKDIYNIPSSPTAGAGKVIALIDAFGASTIEADLNYFSQYFGLPECTTANGCFTKVNQTGGNVYPIDNAGWSMETALDVQYAHAIAPGAKILLVVASSDNFNDIFKAVDYARSRADYVSMSFGAQESSSFQLLNSYFTANPSTSFFASSGDSGAGVMFPAASPNVIGVGGTTLYRSNSQFTEEVAWSSAGGGCSTVFSVPSYQLSNSGYQALNCNQGRAVPDVSYLADPNSGVYVYSTSNGCSGPNCFYVVGGTSLAAPMVAARAAIKGVVIKPEYVYENHILFRDVTMGSNGHPARPGLDLVTGLGSWIGDADSSTIGTTPSGTVSTTSTATTTTLAPVTTTAAPRTTFAPVTTQAPTSTVLPTVQLPMTTTVTPTTTRSIAAPATTTSAVRPTPTPSLATRATPTPTKTCSPGWVSYDIYCYKLFTNGQSYTNASQYCKSQSGYLASVRTWQLNSWINSFVPKSCGEFWIGGSRKSSTDAFKWDDYRTWSYTNFDDNQSINGNYVSFIHSSQFGNVGKWRKLANNYIKPFLCERSY